MGTFLINAAHIHRDLIEKTLERGVYNLELLRADPAVGVHIVGWLFNAQGKLEYVKDREGNIYNWTYVIKMTRVEEE